MQLKDDRLITKIKKHILLIANFFIQNLLKKCYE